ncbi:hypothetical protein SB776_33360, partial [Burkholderia sp. SIMBA_045]
HQGQDQPGADAEKPVQLEQGFLQHVTRLVRSKNYHHGAHYAVGCRETFFFTHKSPVHGDERGLTLISVFTAIPVGASRLTPTGIT